MMGYLYTWIFPNICSAHGIKATCCTVSVCNYMIHNGMLAWETRVSVNVSVWTNDGGRQVGFSLCDRGDGAVHSEGGFVGIPAIFAMPNDILHWHVSLFMCGMWQIQSSAGWFESYVIRSGSKTLKRKVTLQLSRGHFEKMLSFDSQFEYFLSKLKTLQKPITLRAA